MSTLLPMFRQRRPIAQTDPQLRKLCEEMDRAWTHQQLADRCGLSHQTLAHLRANRGDIGFKKITRVAEVLGFEVIIRKKY